MRRLRALAGLLVVTTAVLVAGPLAGGAGRAEAAPRVHLPDGVAAGYVVYDRQAGKVLAQAGEHQRFVSASLVKLLIALDYLAPHGVPDTLPSGDRALLERMLRASDDDAASTFWSRDGSDAIVRRMVAALGLHDTAPPADRRYWGYTTLSASDVVAVYQYLLDRADPSIRDFVVTNLRAATQCAADGHDQYFGIPSALPRPWGVKQGWANYPVPADEERCDGASTRSAPDPMSRLAAKEPLPGDALRLDVTDAAAGLDLQRHYMHTSGLLGADSATIVAVLTSTPAGTSYEHSADVVTDLTSSVVAKAGVTPAPGRAPASPDPAAPICEIVQPCPLPGLSRGSP